MAKNAFKVLLFIVAAAIIVYCYPREGRFRYQFQEGKPWRYGLLTAPYNFSVFVFSANIIMVYDQKVNVCK